MSKYLCTFPGKYGDILWSLPTARTISELVGSKVDFAVMPQYLSLIPLLESQPYIDRAYTLQQWICTGSPHGDQPWLPPSSVLPSGYERMFHLGYKGHPGMAGQPRMPLVDFTAWQQGFQFRQNPLPFLTVEEFPIKVPYIAWAFNDDYVEAKSAFIRMLSENNRGYQFKNVSKLSWKEAATAIRNARAFVGCRSANYVLAHGVGQKCLVFEPHPGRTAMGAWGDVFAMTKYGYEIELSSNNLEFAVSIATSHIRVLEAREDENAKAIAG